jgi:chromate transport protein ChrA
MLHEMFKVVMLKILSEVIVYVNVTHEFFEALKILIKVIVYVNVTRVFRSRHDANIGRDNCLSK